MNPIPPDNTAEEMTRLATVAETLAGFDASLDAEWIDGYLTGLAATGRTLAADDWLPQMCEDSFDRAFGDPASRAEALAVIEARLAVLRRQLDAECLLEWPDRLRLHPWVAEIDEQGVAQARADGASEDELVFAQLGAAWAAGFCDCADRHHVWWPEPADDEAAMIEECWQSIELLFEPAGEPERAQRIARLYPEGEPDREQLLTDALYAVQDLRVWQIDHAPRPETVRAPVLPGRNEPCWCGSGKKFKKCHGA
jgi:uncharacterized protein